MPLLHLFASAADERVYVTGLSTYPSFQMLAILYWVLGIGVLLWWSRRRRAAKQPPWPVLIAGFGLGFVFLRLLDPSVTAEVSGQGKVAASRAHKITTAIQLYLPENNGAFPTASNWEESTQRYLEEPLPIQPGLPYDFDARFALNQNLSGKTESELISPDLTVVIFATKLPGPNAAGVASHLLWARSKGQPYTLIGLLSPYGVKDHYSESDLSQVHWDLLPKTEIVKSGPVNWSQLSD